jgi:hypothetical protein
MGGGMGLRDITLFAFIVIAYIVSFLVYLFNRMFFCDKTVSEDAMWASFVGATFGMILVFIYAILVYTGKCGGYTEYNDKQKVIAFVSVSLLLVSSLGAEITIWKITKPDGSHQGGWVLNDSEEICNWGFVFVLFCLITLFISWFYTGASIPGLLNELTGFRHR